MPNATELNVTTTTDATTLANTMFGDGIQVVSATLTGAATQAGTFTGGETTSAGVVPSDSGVILSTGNVTDFTTAGTGTDTNTSAGTSTSHGGAGDADLDAASTVSTRDAVVFESTFIPDNDYITMQFVFSSEEYLEYVNGGVNDTLGVWVNGTFVPLSANGDTVSIDTINDTSNANLYVDNPAASDLYNTEMDGFTITLSLKAQVNAGVENSIKIGLADGGDTAYDTNVLIAADSVQTMALAFEDFVTLEANTVSVIDVTENDRDTIGDGLSITEINGVAVVPGDSVTLNTGEVVTLNDDYTFSVATGTTLGSTVFTYTVENSAGNSDVGYVNIETVADAPGDGIVEGSGLADLIDGSFAGDPEGDMVDANDALGVNGTTGDDDYIQAFGGNDTVLAGAGDDIVEGGTGNDSIEGGAGADTLHGGDGDDTIKMGDGDNLATGGAGNDLIDDVTGSNHAGSDTIDGGAGNDTIWAGNGNDSVDGGTGDDSIHGEGGDDTITLSNGFGNDTITGGETGETAGDTLDLSAVATGVTLDLSSADPEAGTVDEVGSGAGVTSFLEIENIVLSSGDDTIVLADGGGADVITGFDMSRAPDNSTLDQLDVSGLTTDGSTPITTNDVTVGNDGSGNALLTFPGGESIVLVGVSPAQLSSVSDLEAIGIPPAPDFIVEGTTGDDVIDAGYLGDREGDRVDAGDNQTGTDADSIVADTGNDEVHAGAGADTVEGGAGMDTIFGDAGDDLLYGGDDNDSIFGGTGSDTLNGDLGDDFLSGGADADLAAGGAGNDRIEGDDGNDTLYGGSGADSVYGGAGSDSMMGDAGADYLEGWIGDDTMIGGADGDYIDGGDGADSLLGQDGNDTLLGGNDLSTDTLDGGAGDDSLSAGAGDDILIGGTGADSMFGGSGDDTVVIEDGFGNDTIDGWSTGETDGDTLDLSATTTGVTVDLSASNPEAGTISDGISTASFIEIENIILGGGRDSVVLADGSGADTVQAFDMTDSGDGSTNDQLDVSGLTSDGGTTPVTTNDVTVTADAFGSAVLTFPGGESITLVGVNPLNLSTVDDLVAIGIPDGRDFIVEGSSGNDVIDASYTGDPEGDMVDAGDAADGSDDDVIEAGAGDDSVLAGAGDDSVQADLGQDTVEGGTGADTIRGGQGDDLLDGGAGADLIYGDENNDTILGGAGDDTLDGGTGDDRIEGGADNDSISGNDGNDTIIGGAGDDWLRGSVGNDEMWGGTGDDYIWSGFNDDTIRIENDFGNDTISAEGIDEVTGDVLDLSLVTDDLTIDLTNANPETGTFSDGVSTASFEEIEHIVLGSGGDTIVLADFGGNDTVQAFDMTDSGDGTTVDQLDVTGLTSDWGTTPVHAGDVTVGDDGSGNAVLSFPGGESITLVGVTPAQLATIDDLVSIGIPDARDFIVEGTSGDDVIDVAYTGDPEGDRIDASDHSDGSNDDSVLAGAGDDSIVSGLGDDTVFGQDGADTILGGDGNDSLDGDDVQASGGADSIDGGAGNDTLIGDSFDDTLSGGSGDDSIFAGADDDLIRAGTGTDQVWGEGGDDTVIVEDGFGNDFLSGGETDEVNGDTLDLSNLTVDTTIDLTNVNAEKVTVSDGVDTLSADEFENLILGGGEDTLLLGDGGGSDVVSGFDMADRGDGHTFDQLDVSGVTTDGTTPVTAWDVVVTDTNGDGTGDAILTFPGGESITLEGVLPSQVDTIPELFSIGIPCFTPGAMIVTAQGEMPVERLRPGDMVLTADNGFQPVRWVGSRRLSAEDLADNPNLLPVVIRKGAFGNTRKMVVSPQHGFVMKTDTGERLIRAKHAAELYGGKIARIDRDCESVTYIHILFDQHELVFAEGCRTEAFYPGPQALKSIDREAALELLTLFPDLAGMVFGQDGSPQDSYGPPARPYLKGRDIRAMAKASQGGKPDPSGLV